MHGKMLLKVEFAVNTELLCLEQVMVTKVPVGPAAESPMRSTEPGMGMGPLGRRHPLLILYIIIGLYVTVMLFAIISYASIKIQVI